VSEENFMPPDSLPRSRVVRDNVIEYQSRTAVTEVAKADDYAFLCAMSAISFLRHVRSLHLTLELSGGVAVRLERIVRHHAELHDQPGA
jgi:hypothetical protein